MITREIHPSFPTTCKVSGFLYESDSTYEQGEDMLDVVLPNGILVSGGWYPDGDPSGKYAIMVYRGYERLIPIIKTNNVDSAAQEMQQCVETFMARNLQTVSDSDSTYSPLANI